MPVEPPEPIDSARAEAAAAQHRVGRGYAPAATHLRSWGGTVLIKGKGKWFLLWYTNLISGSAVTCSGLSKRFLFLLFFFFFLSVNKRV